MDFDYEILDLGLVYYKNIIKDPQSIIDVVNDIDRRFASNEHDGKHTEVKEWSPWQYGDTIFNWQKFFPESEDIPETDPYFSELKEVTDNLYSSLQNGFEHYTSNVYPFAKNGIKGREQQIHLLKYGVSGHLPAHQDQGVSSRVLSSVMYLNDDYEGGEIEFVNSGVKLKPEAGSIIFFPSNFLYVHEVHPITAGFRYSMPHWYHNVKNIVYSTGQE